jgi:hypothetical protein
VNTSSFGLTEYKTCVSGLALHGRVICNVIAVSPMDSATFHVNDKIYAGQVNNFTLKTLYLCSKWQPKLPCVTWPRIDAGQLYCTCVTWGFSFCGLLRALTASGALWISLFLSLLTRLLSIPHKPAEKGLEKLKVCQVYWWLHGGEFRSHMIYAKFELSIFRNLVHCSTCWAVKPAGINGSILCFGELLSFASTTKIHLRTLHQLMKIL